jgi:hypothetical protein
MNVDSSKLLIDLKDTFKTVLDNFSEGDRNAIDLLLNRYADLVVRRFNGEDVDVNLAAVKAALTNYRVGASSNVSNVARQFAMDFFTTLIAKIL